MKKVLKTALDRFDKACQELGRSEEYAPSLVADKVIEEYKSARLDLCNIITKECA